MRAVTTFTALLALGWCAAAAPAGAASIGGTLFEDQDRDGVRDAGEPALAGLRVQLLGAGGAIVQVLVSDAGGAYLSSGLPDGQYVVSVRPATNLRASLQQLGADPPPIPDFPFGRPRYFSMPNQVANLRAAAGGVFHHVGLGDSIGFGFNVCGSLFGEDGYFEPTTDRLAGAAAADVDGDKQSIPGHETSHLLEPGISDDFPFTFNDVFYAIDRGAQLVSISSGGNDFLGAEDGGETALAAALVTARQNLQEILSTLVTELPASEIEINTVYDNEQGDDATHNLWVPIWDQVLREVAWGQQRRVALAEIWPEYAHDEGGQIRGEPGLICHDLFGLDGIHPNNDGYDVHEEKLWQAFGGVTLAGGDRLDVDLGFLRLRRSLFPAGFEDVTGGTVNPEAALATDGVGALVPAGGAEFRLVGFPLSLPPALELSQAVLKIRYRTTAAPLDDYYRFEASVDGSFSPPGGTATTWNTILPLVGSAGNDGADRLAFPDQPDFRVVAAPLYVGAPTNGEGTLTAGDLATLGVRLTTVPVGGADAYQIEWDSAWVEVFTAPAPDRESPGERRAGTQPPGDPALARAAGLEALAQKSPDAGLPELLGAVGDPEAAVRLAVARALAGFRGAMAREGLERLARDSEARVRRVAVAALARRDDARAAVLRPLLGDPALAVRVEAAAALLARGDEVGLRTLLDALDVVPASRRAFDALAGHGRAERLAAELARPQGGRVPRSASDEGSLADARDDRAPAEARAAECSDAPSIAGGVQRQAALARILGRLGDASPAVLAALRPLLADPRPGVRAAAADALSRLADAASIPEIAAMAGDPALAVDAARALGRFRAEAALAALRDLAASAAPATARRLAARGLALAGGDVARELLASLAGSDDLRVRRLAAAGLAAAELE